MEDPEHPSRRVVKRVVKKTVVRPAAPSAPVATPSARTRLRAASPRVPAERTAPPVPRNAVPKPPKVRRRPTLPQVALPKFDLAHRLAEARHTVSDHLSEAGHALRDTAADGWHWVIGLRLPKVQPSVGSSISGLLVGLLSVTIGWGFYNLFDATLGTQAGGRWGFIALVLLSFIAFIAGELLLCGFGVPYARAVSALGILLVMLVILLAFLELASGIWAWLLIPLLTSGCFAAANLAMQTASESTNAQRLPWEPTDESQVKRN